jgi:transcriptional regulator with XRE-family HTH domain
VQEKNELSLAGRLAIGGRGLLMGRGARRRPRLLATKLLQIRDGLKLSQGALIERLGAKGYLNQGEISDFEHGVREPDLITLDAYADLAGIPMEFLVKDDVKLPDELPGAEYVRGTVGKPQKGPAKAMSTTVVRFQCLVESDAGVASEEKRAHANIEKRCLKPYRMKKLKEGEYDLILSYQDEEDLNEQIYALFGSIQVEGRKRKCSVTVDIREKDGDRHW